jgi:hypothetical protein
MTTDQLESAHQLIPGALSGPISSRTPDTPLTGSESGATANPSPATAPWVTVTTAARQPETWFVKAGAVLGDVVIAVLLVTIVPLTLIVIVEAVGWLVRAVVGAAGGA